MPIPLVRLNARVSRTYMPSFIKFMPATQWSRHLCLQFNKLANKGPTPKPPATDCIRDFHGSIVSRRLMNNCATISPHPTRLSSQVEQAEPGQLLPLEQPPVQ